MLEPKDPVGLYAQRNVLLLDRDGRRRARAATALGVSGDARVIPWLLDATSDPAPMVRGAAWSALVKVGDASAFERAKERATTEPVWWVRRAAVMALAACDEVRGPCAVAAVLDDPFWRVRWAAVRVLGALGEVEPQRRAEMLRAIPAASVAQAAGSFLRALWEGSAPQGVVLERNASRQDDGLWNADPAVVTARLERAPDGSLDPLALIEFLSDSHEPLRRQCLRILTRVATPEVLKAACFWLDQPRVPHAAATAEALLDRVDGRAEPVAAWALAQHGRPGVQRWAMAWVERRGCEALFDVVDRLRAAAPEAPSDEEMLARAFAARNLDALHHAAKHGGFAERAQAIEGLSALGALSDAAREALVRDEDPWVRAAAMDLPSALTLLVRDVDSGVRHAAMRWILREREGLTPEARVKVARDAFAQPDARLHAKACRLLPTSDDAVALLLAASVTTTPAVRFAAALRLERMADLDLRIEALLDRGGLDPRAEIGAYTWRLRAMDDDARARLQRAVDAPSCSPSLRSHLVAMSQGMNDPLPIERVETSAASGASVSVRPRKPLVERRSLGPLAARPLAISGVHQLPARCYAKAFERGAELFFWEPHYRELTTFLRGSGIKHGARVIAGSFEGSAAGIRRDVERALRRLRSERIDVFLLFWARSPERLSEEALTCLLQLKQSGHIGAVGFSTHHREIARAAIASQPWDVVMTRHSAAHPGAESALIPEAKARGTAVLTFSAISYGRMLKVPAGVAREGYGPLPTAADCYRYSLAQPGVAACISAPRTAAEMHHNLAVLEGDALSSEAEGALRAHGARVHEASQRFNAFIRQAQAPGLTPARSTALGLLDEAEGESEVA